MEQQDNIAEAWEVLQGKEHVFLTGPAGSGKSTLMRKFIDEHAGEVIVTAPTGIAAINVGGVTVHSFFHFPARTLNYNAIKFLNDEIDADWSKKMIIARAKYLIIDEISMLRADIMDQIAWFFKKNFPDAPPFGGLKVIMVGDVDQLPPVVKEGPESELLRARYISPFFFDAHCWDPKRYAGFRTVKLTKIWRQSDPVFINLLNDIKNARCAPFDIDRLNNTCFRPGTLKPEDGILLCANNKIVAEVNSVMMQRLDTKSYRFTGALAGKFSLSDCVVEEHIELKIGCRVMTMRNSKDRDNDYRNGSIGVFEEVDEAGNLIIKLDTGNTVTVGKYVFESTDYAYDKEKDKITHKVTGQFVQFPVKVAYAITIHKSQGQTFDKVVIDMGENGAFAHGQTYVALSRCRSMEGIILRRHIRSKDLIYDQNVLSFNRK